jgi:hypothetical protein
VKGFRPSHELRRERVILPRIFSLHPKELLVNLVNQLKSKFMKNDLPIPESSPSKIFFKITLFGFFLLGFAGMFLMIVNNVLKALH